MVRRNDRQVILNFVSNNLPSYQNDTNDYIMNNKFDDSIESIDYDLDTFETHESLQSQKPILIDSGRSTFTYTAAVTTPTPTEYLTTQPTYETTMRRTTLTTSSTSTTTTTMEPTILTDPPTILTDPPTTESPTTVLTTTPSTTTLLKTSSSSTTAFITTSLSTPEMETTKFTEQQNVMIFDHGSNNNPNPNRNFKDSDFDIFAINENQNANTNNRNNNNNKNKGNHKNRKHNHKKQHKHEHVFSEIEDVEEVNTNLELKPEKDFDFDVFDREVHLIEPSKGKKKHKTSGRSGSSEERERDRQRATKGKHKERERDRNVDRDSDIHILRTEKAPEAAIPSTTVTTNSKIIEIKPSQPNKTGKRQKRYTDDLYYNDRNVLILDNEVPSISEDDLIVRNIVQEKIPPPEQLIGTIPNFTKNHELAEFQQFLFSILGDTGKFEPKDWFSNAPSLEFLNFVLALLVWSVRYPSVFWETSKAFTIIFSIQMVANSIDILMLYAGTSILFKLQVVGQYVLVQVRKTTGVLYVLFFLLFL